MPHFYFILVFFMAGLISCSKYEGTGGKSSIMGKIELNQRLYVNGKLTDSVSLVGAKEDVFIVYGDEDAMIDDKVECSYDGTFKFTYLQPGTYTIFAYSELFNTGKNTTNNDDDFYIKQPVKITLKLGKNEHKDIGSIRLIK
jgi:phosphatidate phosphatase PAH1